MKKRNKILISLCVFVLLCFIFFVFVKFYQYKEFKKNEKFMEGTIIHTEIDDIDIGGMSATEAYEKYLQTTNTEINATVEINHLLYDIDLTNNFENTAKLEYFQNAVGKETFFDYLFHKPKQYSMDKKISYIGGAGDKLKDFILSGEYEYMESKDAYFDKKNITIVDEIIGNEINAELATSTFEKSIQDGEFKVDLNDESLYLKPEVYADDLEKKYSNVIKLLDWTAEYPDYEHKIKLSDYKGYVSVNDDGTYKIDNSFLKKAVLELSKKVDKTYDSIKFYSRKGEITVKGGTYGRIMDNSKEVAFLKEKLSKNESVNDRIPIWKCKPLPEGKNPDNYIEVDLTKQHLWHYKDGKLCCESNVVTGDSGKKRETPTGAYYITEKKPGKYLVGDNYKTWVNRWMRLTNSGVGLHDAGWRGSFGGTIYQVNGSHGCVNLPKDFAYKLYDEVDIGILTVIHK